MLSRLKKIAKRAAAVIATGIITLTALPAIPVHASGGVINYHVYQNAKQLYDSVADTSWIYTTPRQFRTFLGDKEQQGIKLISPEIQDSWMEACYVRKWIFAEMRLDTRQYNQKAGGGIGRV